MTLTNVNSQRILGVVKPAINGTIEPAIFMVMEYSINARITGTLISIDPILNLVVVWVASHMEMGYC